MRLADVKLKAKAYPLTLAYIAVVVTAIFVMMVVRGGAL